MRKAIFTYFKSWRNANALLLGLAILITGFTPVSQPVVELATYTPSINSTCSGNVPIQNLANGMDYTITVGAGGTVDITVRVVDNPAGLVGFLGGPGNPISFPNGTGTFTYSLTGQSDPYVLNMFFNWAAGGQGSSEPVSCSSSVAPTVCTGNVPIQNLANGMDYTITVGAGGAVDITVRVVDNPAGLVGFLGGPGNPISFPNGTGTFTYSLTGQSDPYVLNMFFNWAAGGQGSSEPVSCSSSPPPPPPVPPGQPVGFIAINPTSSSGFLAVGPNNVGTNNIVYRLFYSPTASAPANPLNATQHTFGSIPGDGNGTAAFGFNRGGLTAATPYTFWLYQYNTASMLYSTPAVATLTTLSPPVLPTTNAPNPTCPPANVVSIYGDFYSPNIATNYNPNWGQSGFALTNPNYNPGTGNVILAYRNFNYQGTELTQTNLSNMAYLNFDVWTDASPSTTTLQVSPINQGTGPSEVLVTVPYVRGQWTRISLPKSAFGGMTWNAVFQMKFAANGPASLVPVDIYLDNIFFSTTNCAPPPTVVCKNATVALGGNGSYTLTAADVFNAAASVNNCAGALNVTNISPAAVSCAQLGQTIPVTVTVQDGCGNTATCTAQITVQQGSALPGGWSSNNVGNANGSGSYKPCTGAEFTLTASGFSTSSADVMHLVSRQLCGNGEIIARVGNIQNSGWAGITLRESLAPGSKMVALKMQSNISNIRRMIRATTNGAASNLNYFRPQDTWLRLVRNGSNFIGYTSSNGTSWSFAFSATIPMAGCVYAGLFAESINVNVITTAVFGNVSITGGAPTLATDINAIVTAAPELKVYPNPTSGEITLDLSACPARNLRIELYNIQGKVLQIVEKDNAETNTESFNLSAYGAGIYLIRVQSEGLPDAVKRVIVQ